MATSVEWSDPQVVFEWDKQQTRLFLIRAWQSITICTWLLWMVALPVAYFLGRQSYSPQSFSRFFGSLIVLALLFPTVFTLLICNSLLMKLVSKQGDRYELNGKGIFRHSSSAPLRVSWKRIENWRFAQHQELSEIRVLEFKIKGIKGWHCFSFNPRDVEEEQVNAVLVENLGGDN
jgi:hypothetical protein